MDILSSPLQLSSGSIGMCGHRVIDKRGGEPRRRDGQTGDFRNGDSIPDSLERARIRSIENGPRHEPISIIINHKPQTTNHNTTTALLRMDHDYDVMKGDHCAG
jgi:hypothetical protein